MRKITTTPRNTKQRTLRVRDGRGNRVYTAVTPHRESPPCMEGGTDSLYTSAGKVRPLQGNRSPASGPFNRFKSEKKNIRVYLASNYEKMKKKLNK